MLPFYHEYFISWESSCHFWVIFIHNDILRCKLYLIIELLQHSKQHHKNFSSTYAALLQRHHDFHLPNHNHDQHSWVRNIQYYLDISIHLFQRIDFCHFNADSLRLSLAFAQWHFVILTLGVYISIVETRIVFVIGWINRSYLVLLLDRLSGALLFVTFVVIAIFTPRILSPIVNFLLGLTGLPVKPRRCPNFLPVQLAEGIFCILYILLFTVAWKLLVFSAQCFYTLGHFSSLYSLLKTIPRWKKRIQTAALPRHSSCISVVSYKLVWSSSASTWFIICTTRNRWYW